MLLYKLLTKKICLEGFFLAQKIKWLGKIKETQGLSFSRIHDVDAFVENEYGGQ